MRIQFGANPGIQDLSQLRGSDKAAHNLARGFMDLNEARIPKQADKAARKITRNTIGLGFRLIGEGLLEMIKNCFHR